MTEFNDGRPFATLEDARDAVRELKTTSGLPAGGLKVRVRNGVHALAHGVHFGPEDSGTAAAPVVYCPAEGETVRLLGGRQLDPAAWTPVTDPAVRSRLTGAAKEHVVQIDLTAQGVTDLGPFVSRGFGRDAGPAHLELFFNDLPMTVAQWPNAGQFAEITGFTKPVTNPWGQEAGDLTGGVHLRRGSAEPLGAGRRHLGTRVLGLRLGQLLRAGQPSRSRKPPSGNRPAPRQPPFHPGAAVLLPQCLWRSSTNPASTTWTKPPASSTSGLRAHLSEAEAVVSEVSEPLLTLQDVSHA